MSQDCLYTDTLNVQNRIAPLQTNTYICNTYERLTDNNIYMIYLCKKHMQEYRAIVPNNSTQRTCCQQTFVVAKQYYNFLC